MTRLPVPHPERWRILIGYWIVQAIVLYAVAVFFYRSTGGGEWELLPLREYLGALADNDLLGTAAIWVPILTGLQLILVLPIRLRILRHKRSKSVHASMAAAGALIALLVVAFGATVSEVIAYSDIIENPEWSWTAVWVGLGLSWAVFTTLLVRYARRSALTNDDLITRVARMIFAGTVIETAALIPLDVMIRRKTDCYCWASSLASLILAGAIGFIVAGPAVFLPVISRRPAWLKAGRCGWCGYDRAGLAPDAPCPECGGAGRGLCEWCGYHRRGLKPDAPCPECGKAPPEGPA